MCPVSMTYSVIPALREAPDLAEEWEPRLTKPCYEDGALAGMAMTEKQGGSDVRANTTDAEPAGDGTYEITGHKWFCSYPSCDVFLTLAQSPAGLSCFLFEGERPRLPRSSASRTSSARARCRPREVEFQGVRGRLVGEEGRGVRTIVRMVNHTRLDCLIGSASAMRWGLAQAVHHARHRAAFGRLLAEQPLMQNVLADLAIESEAATATAMRVARAYDEQDCAVPALRDRRHEVLGLQARAPACARGARVPRRQRLRGGVRDAAAAARLAAQLDLGGLGQRSRARRPARAPLKEPEGLPAFLAECELARGGDARLDAHLDRLRDSTPADPEFEARRLVGDLALALQASLLVRNAPPAVADAFCAGRLEGGRPRVRNAAAGGRRRGDRRSGAARPDLQVSGGRFTFVVLAIGAVAIVAVVVLNGGLDLSSDAEEPAARETPEQENPAQPPALPDKPDEVRGSDAYALTRTPNFHEALQVLEGRRQHVEGEFESIRVAPGRIDTVIVHPDDRRTSIQIRPDMKISSESTHDFPTPADFREDGLRARMLAEVDTGGLLRAIDGLRRGSAAHDVDYIVLGRDIIDGGIDQSAYMRIRTPHPRAFSAEHGEELRPIG